jgi:tetratricopeptide (TPR) repeat protein
MTVRRVVLLTSFSTLLALGVAFSPVQAAGSNSGSSNSGGSGADTAPSAANLGCKKKQVVKKVKKNGKMVWGCVDKTAGVLTDEELYQQGAILAKEGHYEWALDVLTSITNQDDPKVLNYIGYSHRKAGRIETGVEFYRKALAINPDFVLAREYLGEGYVAAGRIDLAQVELAEIGKRCGVTCEEYKALSDVISKAVN